MPSAARHRARLAWHTARYFLRMLLEYVATVWLLGIAPFLAHLAVAPPERGYAWIPADLSLFVMVLGGNIAIEAFKDRASDGPSRPAAALVGTIGAACGAVAFASLQTGRPDLNTVLRPLVYRAVVVALTIDMAYRFRLIYRMAAAEAMEKGGC